MNYVKSQMRLPPDLYDGIRSAAEASGRSMNSEIVHRLRSYRDDGTQRKLDQIIALLTPASPAKPIKSPEGTVEYFRELEQQIADRQVSTMRMPATTRRG